MAKGSSVGSTFSYQSTRPLAAAFMASSGQNKIYPVNSSRQAKINFFFIVNPILRKPRGAANYYNKIYEI